MFRPALLALAALAATAARASDVEDPARWRKYPFGSMWIVTDASEPATRALARQLASFRAVLEDTTTHLRFEKVTTTHIVAFRNADDLPTPPVGPKEGIDWRGFHLAAPVAGFETFIVTTTQPAQPVESSRLYKSFQAPSGVAVHEYVHHVVAASFGSFPRWLDEGLATFYSTYWADRRVAEIGRPPRALLRDTLGMKPIPMARLFALDEREWGAGVTVTALYGQSWAVVHYLLRGNPERGEQFGRFLYLLRQGRPEAEAWDEAFGLPPDTVRDEAFAYLRKGVFAVRRYDLKALHWEPLGDPVPLAKGELLGLMSKIRLRFDDFGGAQARAEAALAEEAEQPRALQTMSALKAHQGAKEEAIAWGERALRAALGDRALELEATMLLDALGDGERARRILDGQAPAQP